MWSRNFEFCRSCNSTLFIHKARGFCVKCYRVDRNKAKLESELQLLSDHEIFEEKRPLLSHLFWNNNNRDELVNEIIGKEEAKLHFLKIYGSLESGKMKPDLLKFEFIFNEIAVKLTKSNSFYTQRLDTLHSSLNEEQRKLLLMQLLKVLIK